MALWLASAAPAFAGSGTGTGTTGFAVGNDGSGDATNRDPPTPGVAMAGTFFGSLPVAACAQADVLLRLHAGGRYALQSHCRATLEDLAMERGTWSVEWNGTCVRLAPDDGARVHEFALAMDDLLVLAAGSCIEPVEDPRGRSLHRAQPDRIGD